MHRTRCVGCGLLIEDADDAVSLYTGPSEREQWAHIWCYELGTGRPGAPRIRFAGCHGHLAHERLNGDNAQDDQSWDNINRRVEGI
jgi:hypothetical protein